MAEVRCGAKVEPREEILIRDSRRRLPGSDTVAPKRLQEVGVGCGIGCGGGELLKLLKRLIQNLCTLPPALYPVGPDGCEAYESLRLRAAKRHVLPPFVM
ncbi:aminotransferase class I/II-fold pyridoxal phosphate-dependent enzyme [Babesia caballi]|uniref:Aminotransferase class I/II-fold pyridoxal phosphate-dependent enzyme n=1 Tax=Babesia caballi TaxID=5871 RepID=A0AAV4LW26_BABCB|nr:aminotransferase class I/II-fold pyridoxal phosphate-dependent enzyme [Babesia caballi]